MVAWLQKEEQGHNRKVQKQRTKGKHLRICITWCLLESCISEEKGFVFSNVKVIIKWEA